MPQAEPPSLPPHRQRRKDARSQELLDAALELFVEKGFMATRSEEVAALAGVSKGTLYLYYPSKEELLKAVIRERLSSEITGVIAEAAQYDGNCAALLRDLLSRWWLRVFESPASGVFKLIITEVRSFPDIADFYFQEVVKPGKELIGGILQRGIEAGEFHPVDIECAVHSLVLPMIMLCLHRHSLGVCAPVESLTHPKAFIYNHVDLVLRGLETRPAPRPMSLATEGPRP